MTLTACVRVRKPKRLPEAQAAWANCISLLAVVVVRPFYGCSDPGMPLSSNGNSVEACSPPFPGPLSHGRLPLLSQRNSRLSRMQRTRPVQRIRPVARGRSDAAVPPSLLGSSWKGKRTRRAGKRDSSTGTRSRDPSPAGWAPRPASGQWQPIQGTQPRASNNCPKSRCEPPPLGGIATAADLPAC